MIVPNDAFGNETIYSKNPTHNPWRFSSKRTDSETGLVYFGRRYYDPTIGKWLTQDPLGVKEGPNLYAYVLNCPMTNFDEYGLYVEDDRGNMHFTKESLDRELAARRDGRQDAHDRADSKYGYQMYTSFNYTNTYSLLSAKIEEEEENESGGFWATYGPYIFSSIEGICLAMDVHSNYVMLNGAMYFNG